MQKTSREIKESKFANLQTVAVTKRSRRVFENVPTLVASITPEFKTVEENGKQVEKKIGETTLIFPNRLCPVASRMTGISDSF
jgi:hypothetical protein